MRSLAALSLAALTAGCSLTNDTVLVAMLVQSPAPPAGLGLAVTQTTLAQVYLGQTDVTGPSPGDVSPISGATVQLYDNGGLVTGAVFAESPPGFYQASGDFYLPAHTYRFVARVGSDEYWGEVTNAPSAPAMTLPTPTSFPFTDVYNYASYAAMGTSVALGRAACGGICDVAFYGVWTVSAGGTFDGSATPNCTNAPQDAAALLDFAFLDDTAWRLQTFNVSKATCFPAPNPYPGAYAVGLTALKKGTTSSNTSIASAVLVGTSDAAGVVVTAQ